MKEPLVHFLALGALLFVSAEIVKRPDSSRPDRIVVTAGDIERMASLWKKQWRRPPTRQELEGLVEDHIREEVYYREAVALGLDQDDSIIRRRLAQKLEFLNEDPAIQSAPTEEELAQFLSGRPELFEVPATVSFTHVYVSMDEHGEKTEEVAKAVLEQLFTTPDLEQARRLGDPFVLQRRYIDKSAAQIGRHLGTDFAERLFETEGGRWSGPIESTYGLHLVFIEARTEAFRPSLAEVREQVENELIAQRRREADEAAYASLRERYAVEVDEAALQAGLAELQSGERDAS